jgi:hypothetical protein
MIIALKIYYYFDLRTLYEFEKNVMKMDKYVYVKHLKYQNCIW